MTRPLVSVALVAPKEENVTVEIIASVAMGVTKMLLKIFLPLLIKMLFHALLFHVGLFQRVMPCLLAITILLSQLLILFPFTKQF